DDKAPRHGRAGSRHAPSDQGLPRAGSRRLDLLRHARSGRESRSRTGGRDGRAAVVRTLDDVRVLHLADVFFEGSWSPVNAWLITGGDGPVLVDTGWWRRRPSSRLSGRCGCTHGRSWARSAPLSTPT